MVGLVVAVGAKSSSSQRLAPSNPQPDETDDGIPLTPLPLFQSVAFGNCPLQEWSIRMTCSYYDLLQPDGKRDTTMAEIRLQVAPVVKNFSSGSYRETTHHLKLPDGAQDEYIQSTPQLLVSPDRRNVACLLFHPHQQSSAVVIFQLRKPLEGNNPSQTPKIPLPSYLTTTGGGSGSSSGSSSGGFGGLMGSSSSPTTETINPQDAMIQTLQSPAVASHPRFASVWGITCMTNLPAIISPPILLAASQDGTLVWMDYRSSLTIATGKLSGIHGAIKSISAQCTSLEQGSLLVVFWNETARLYTWNMDQPLLQQTLLRRKSTPAMSIQLSQEINHPSSPTERTQSSGTKPSATGLSSFLHSAASQQYGNKTQSPKPTKSPSLSEQPRRAIPARTKSDLVASTQQAWGDMVRTISPKIATARMGIGRTIAKRRNRVDAAQRSKSEELKRHMDQFVLRELQKKTGGAYMAGGASTTMTMTTTMTATGGSTNRSPRQRRRQSDTATTSDTNKRQMHLHARFDVLEHVQSAIFISSTVILVVTTPNAVVSNRNVPLVAQAFGVAETDASMLRELAYLELPVDRLEDYGGLGALSASSMDSSVSLSSSSSTFVNKCSVDYDVATGCCIVTTMYPTEHSLHGLTCLWNWRLNVLGFIATHPPEENDDAERDSDSSSTSTPSLLSAQTCFGRSGRGGLYLVRVEISSLPAVSRICTKKHVYEAAILSPSSSQQMMVSEPYSILLGGLSVSFPIGTKVGLSTSNECQNESS